MSNPRNDRMAKLRAQRARLRRKSRRENIIVGTLAVLGGLALVAGVVILSGLITMLAWNIGVVGIVSACGGAVGKISLGIAICANLAIGIASRLFRRTVTVAK